MGKYMPSDWFKMKNGKIPHLKFCRLSDNQWQKLCEKLLFK